MTKQAASGPLASLGELVATSPDEHKQALFPKLSEAQIERIARCAERRSVPAGQVLFEQGQRNRQLFVVLSGALEVVRPTEFGTEELIGVLGPGQFSGEIDILLNRPSVVRGRVRDQGGVLVLDRELLRELVTADSELSDVFLRTFIVRRLLLIEHAKGDLVLVGSLHSADTLRLREFLTRNGHPYSYLDVDSHPGIQELLSRFNVEQDDIPVVVYRSKTVLRNPSTRELAELIGISLELDPQRVWDLLVIGAGPAGLASAVYATSEGLDVLVLEAEAPGGQASHSSKIENYLGFPTDISGEELAGRAFTQAAKFGAEFSVAKPAKGLDCGKMTYTVGVEGAGEVKGRSVVIACGARYRKLPLAECELFENAGIYHAATHIEAQLCRGDEVAIVGGGNSAGQAATFLAPRTRHVHMLVRSDGLSDSMSRYLIRRIEESPNITVHTRAEVVALEGQGRLERVTWRDNRTGEIVTRPIRHLFLMMGADPNTRWLDGCVVLDDKGFIKTGIALQHEELARAGWPRSRPPYSLETSLPGVFAVGDARSGSVKRVASAVGEGAACVQLVHHVLRE